VAAPRLLLENSAIGTLITPPLIGRDVDGNQLVYALYTVPLDPQTGVAVFSINVSTAGLILDTPYVNFEVLSWYSVSVLCSNVVARGSLSTIQVGSLLIMCGSCGSVLLTCGAVQAFNITVVDMPEPPYTVPPFSLFPLENTLPGVTLDRSFKYEDQDWDGVLLIGVVAGNTMFTLRRSLQQDADPTHHWFDCILLPFGWLNYEGGTNSYNTVFNITDGIFFVSTAVLVQVVNVNEPPSFGLVSYSIAENDAGFALPVVLGQGMVCVLFLGN
jgi:hypothetical protein